MSSDRDQRLAAAAASHHAVFDHRVLDEIGFTKREREIRLAAGRWVELFNGVYRIAGAPTSWRGELAAAVLASTGRGAASHRSAAALVDLPGGDRALQELLALRWRRVQRAGLIVHETKSFSIRDLTVVDGIRCTTVERTLVDLGAVRRPRIVERAVEAALRRQLVSEASLAAAVRRIGGRGRNGVGVLRRILDERTPGRALTESDMEFRLLQVLRAHGLPEPVVQYEIRDHGRFIARVDAAYVEFKIAIEYDSFDWHLGASAHVRDNARRNALLSIQWKPIVVTWADLRSGGTGVCGQILDLMRKSA